MKLLVYAFYRYYSSGRDKIVAYEAALLILTALLFLNLLSLIKGLGGKFWELLGEFGLEDRGTLYLGIGLCWTLPTYLILKKCFPKHAIVSVHPTETQLLKGNLIALTYVLTTLALFVFAAFQPG